MANILPDGGRGIGVNPRGTEYPFVDPSANVRHLLADAYLAYAVDNLRLPLRVVSLAGFDAAFLGQVPTRADVVIVDADGATAFDSTAATYRTYAFGARLRVHEWVNATTVCRFVQHTAFADAAQVVAWPTLIVPGDGTLDERVSEVITRRVASLGDPDTGVSVAQDVVFANGYNTTMEVTESRRGLRVITQLIYAAEPGDGLGRYPGCAEPDLVVRSINHVRGGEFGDFQLSAAGCYWVRQPTQQAGGTATPTPGTLHLGNDCGPCCECEDFVRVQKGVLRTWDRFVGVAADAEASRDIFRDVVDAWQAEKTCVESKVVQVVISPFGDIFAEVVVSICNHTTVCLVDVVVTIEATTSAPDGGSVIRAATQISDVRRGLVAYTLGGTWPNFNAYFDAVQARTNGVLRFRVTVPKAQPGTTLGLRVTAATLTPVAGLNLPQTVETTAIFEG